MARKNGSAGRKLAVLWGFGVGSCAGTGPLAPAAHHTISTVFKNCTSFGMATTRCQLLHCPTHWMEPVDVLL